MLQMLRSDAAERPNVWHGGATEGATWSSVAILRQFLARVLLGDAHGLRPRFELVVGVWRLSDAGGRYRLWHVLLLEVHERGILPHTCARTATRVRVLDTCASAAHVCCLDQPCAMPYANRGSTNIQYTIPDIDLQFCAFLWAHFTRVYAIDQLRAGADPQQKCTAIRLQNLSEKTNMYFVAHSFDVAQDNITARACDEYYTQT